MLPGRPCILFPFFSRKGLQQHDFRSDLHGSTVSMPYRKSSSVRGMRQTESSGTLTLQWTRRSDRTHQHGFDACRNTNAAIPTGEHLLTRDRFAATWVQGASALADPFGTEALPQKKAAPQ
jgi:hypothetical protein